MRSGVKKMGTKFVVDLTQIHNNVNKILKTIPSRAYSALNEIANDVSGEAKDLAPVKKGFLQESIRGEVVKDNLGNTSAAIIYVPSNHQASTYAIKMHENTYNLGKGSVLKQQRTGKIVGKKFITRAIDNRSDRIKKIIEYYFRNKK